MKLKTLFFVAGIAPTPEETTAILALAESGANIEVLSVEKMQPESPVDLHGVQALAGVVPTNYADAFAAQGPATPPAVVEGLGVTPAAASPAVDLSANAEWQTSQTVQPPKRGK